jgi:hypothetical protein
MHHIRRLQEPLTLRRPRVKRISSALRPAQGLSLRFVNRCIRKPASLLLASVALTPAFCKLPFEHRLWDVIERPDSGW